MFNIISLQQKLQYSQLSVCLQNIIIQNISFAKRDHNKNVETVSFKSLNLINKTLHKYYFWVIPPETKQFLTKKNSWSLIFFSIKYTNIGPIRVHNTEYQPPVTSG